MKRVELNTAQEITKALVEGKTVYEYYMDKDKYRTFKLVNGICVAKYYDGETIICDYCRVNKEHNFYYEEKEPIKLEVGKFYRTREGDKAICLNKDKAVGNQSEYVYMIHCIGFPCHYWTDKNGKKEKYLVSDLDIVDYWE